MVPPLLRIAQTVRGLLILLINSKKENRKTKIKRNRINKQTIGEL